MSENRKGQIYDSLSNDQKAVQIPYYLHEAEMTRIERLNKRWFIAFLIVLVMLFASNLAWVIYEMSYETFYYAQEAQSDSGDAAALLTTGEGSVNFYGDAREAGDESSGQENQQQQSDEAVPDV